MQKMVSLVFLIVCVHIVSGNLVIHVEEEDHEHSGSDCDNKKLQRLEADLAEIKENRLAQLEANVTDLITKFNKKEIRKKGCKDGWTVFQESCYFFGKSELSFSDAESFCVGLDNSHLVNIETSTEYTFIATYLRDWKGQSRKKPTLGRKTLVNIIH